MPGDSADLSRRRLLEILGTGSLSTLAGCNQSKSTPASESTVSSPTTSFPSPTPTDSPTPIDEADPTILLSESEPRDDGTVLAVRLEGEDDRELAEARIVYGDREIVVQPEGNTVTIEDRFEDAAASSPTDGRVAFILVDGAGNENRAYVQLDVTAPNLAFSAEPTDRAGEVAVEIDAQDDTGLSEVRAFLGRETGEQFLGKDVAGQKRYTEGLTFTVPSDERFQRNRFTALVEDWNGNSRRKRSLPYVRKYDVMEDTRLSIGVDYFPLGRDMFTECLEEGVDTEPVIDDYGGRPIHPKTTTKHFDQMLGHGIERARFVFGGAFGQFQMMRNFLRAGLQDEITVSAGYYLGGNHRLGEDAGWPEKVRADMPVFRDNILSRDNVSRYDGRPLFTVSHVSRWLINRSEIQDEWGNYENFVDELRSLLTVDGTEPFMVAGVGSSGYSGYSIYEDLVKHFDAVTTGKAGPILKGDIPAEEVKDFVEQNYRGHLEFAEEHDMEFVPQVFPGFDDRANTCWGEDRYIPRDPELFSHLLQLADEYRTTDMINVETWNDWTEGTQIEPGRFRGNDYGTTYLNFVKEFQLGGAG